MLESHKETIANIIEEHYVASCENCEDCYDKCICGQMLGESKIAEHQADLIMHLLKMGS